METIRPTTGIAIDPSHQKANGLYPLKLRVIYDRKPRYFAITIESRDGHIIDSLSPEDLLYMRPKKTTDKSKLKELTYQDNIKFYKELSLLLADKEKFANEIISELKDAFTFEAFSDRFTGKKKASDPGNIFYRYAETIKELEKNNQIGTASSYDLSMKSLKSFVKSEKGKQPEKLFYKEITPAWLRRYENFMITDKPYLLPDGKLKLNAEGKVLIKPGLTRTTVGIYLRPLRAIFNAAIDAKEVDQALYPFGKKKYEIPKGQKVKKALTKDQLKLLFNAEADTQEQLKARDFWFFSYTCNGMNVKDICLLRNESLETDSLNFFRSKTKNTNKDQHPVNVMLTDYAKTIIEKHRNQDRNPKAFVFDILSQTDTPKERQRKVQLFTRYINTHIKKLAKKVGITEDISTYFARHSFATLAIQGGASIEFVSEALSHSDIKTTRGYFAGFADITKKDILEGLMNFNN